MSLEISNGKLKIDGLTWYQWARLLFAGENCAECGKGVKGREEEIVMGNWFARCKERV